MQSEVGNKKKCESVRLVGWLVEAAYAYPFSAPSNCSFLSCRVVFHFHDYRKKGRSLCLQRWKHLIAFFEMWDTRWKKNKEPTVARKEPFFAEIFVPKASEKFWQ